MAKTEPRPAGMGSISLNHSLAIKGYRDFYFEVNSPHVCPLIIVPFTSSGGEKKRSDGFEKDPEGNIFYLLID